MNATEHAPMIDHALHSQANFNPQDYAVLAYLDNVPPAWGLFCPPFGCSDEVIEHARREWQVAVDGWNREMDQYFPGRRQNDPSIHKCTHCGNVMVRYITAVKHIPTGQVVVFGDICVDRLNFANRDEFKAAQLRARAAQGNANLVIYRKRVQFLEDHPAFAAIINGAEIQDPVHARNTFAHDILAKFNCYGELSDRQLECFVDSLGRDRQYAARQAQREVEHAARVAAGVTAPEGRLEVEGKVLSTKQQESLYGIVLKTLVELTSGAHVWVSVPSSASVEVGNSIRFTATFQKSATDPLFSFGSRPSKLTVL